MLKGNNNLDGESLPESSAVAPASSEMPRGFFNPYVQILLNVVLAAAAQIFLKKGADESVHSTVAFALGFSGLNSPWVWAGIVCLIGSLLAWVYALRFVQLIVAFNLAGLLHVIIPLVSWYFLGEKLGAMRVLGIGLVFVGVLMVAKPIIKMEEL